MFNVPRQEASVSSISPLVHLRCNGIKRWLSQAGILEEPPKSKSNAPFASFWMVWYLCAWRATPPSLINVGEARGVNENWPKNVLTTFIIGDWMLMVVVQMNEEVRKTTGIKLGPSIVKRARIRAVSTDKTLGEWVEEAIEEKAAREEAEERQPKWEKTCGNRSFWEVKIGNNVRLLVL